MDRQLLTVDDAERLAEEVVPPEAWGYIAGGAGDERTLTWNREAFSRCRLRPRVLVDVSSVSTETTVLGTPVSMPVLVAPTAFQRLVHPDGEVACAQGAAAAGTVYCLSTLSSVRPAEVAAVVPDAPRWFQLYWSRDREFTRAAVLRRVVSGEMTITEATPLLGVSYRQAKRLAARFRSGGRKDRVVHPGD